MKRIRPTKMQRLLPKLAWLVLGAAALLALAGCATPQRDSRARVRYADGSEFEAETHETGYPLFFGERRDVATVPGAEAGGAVSKRTMGVTGGALGGAGIGALSGNPAVGALVGTIAGGLGQALDSARDDTNTSSTLKVVRHGGL